MPGKADGLFFHVSGHSLPISNMFDFNGDETDNPRDAVSLITLLPDGRWMAIQCSERDIHKEKLN